MIKIQKLQLENFKCHKFLELDFDGRNASIYGDNAAGKTSVYDALTWLLFGKDSQGNGEKNIDIKPLDEDGNVKDHEAITSVEAELLSDGIPVSLKRTLREVWSTKRGSSAATYDGNTSDYYVDGVPCKKYVYDAKIDDIVDEKTFRILTNVKYFAEDMDWKSRRQVLFDISGTYTDMEIMGTDSRFYPLAAEIGRLSVDDYKKKQLAIRKGYSGTRNEIPARLSECKKTVEDLSGLDFDTAKQDLAAYKKERDTLAAQLIALEHNAAADSKRNEIAAANLELERLRMENDQFRTVQTTAHPDGKQKKWELEQLQLRLTHTDTLLRGEQKSVLSLEADIENCRNQWIAINNEVFSGGDCPTCGQKLPAEQLQRTMAAFDKEKAKRLSDVEQNANQYKSFLVQSNQRIEELEKEKKQLAEQISDCEAEVKTAEAMPQAEVHDMDGYLEHKNLLSAKITALQEELCSMERDTDGVKSSIREKMNDLSFKISAKSDLIGKESALQYAQRRMEDLRQQAENAAAQMEEIDKMLFLLEDYTRYKTSYIEDGINRLFKLAKFRLFREQANGGVEDRCDVTFNGIPYSSLNNGAKINVGIDIINTLSRMYGTNVPLFVDNAESVTRLEHSANQVVRLVVSEQDKELRCAYEN